MIKKLILASVFCFLALAGTHHVLAQQTDCDPTKGYCLLAPIPIGGNTTSIANQVDIVNYIPNAVKLIIALATGLAVLMIIFGGFQYILSTVPGTKASGKEYINNALIGLLLITASYSILYTLNPKLVNLSLSLSHIADAPKITGDLAAGTPTTGDTTGGTAGTPSTSGHAPVGSNNCGSSCVSSQDAAFTFKQKPPGQACTTTGGSLCSIDPALGTNLTNIQSALDQTSVTWQVTEMTPPTVYHDDPCHANGTCVDAAVRGPLGSNGKPTDTALTTFFTTLDNTPGITYEYEACGADLTALTSDKALQNWWPKMKCENTTQNGSSGQSAHINGPNAKNKSFGGGASGTF